MGTVGGLIESSKEYIPNTRSNVYIQRYGKIRALNRTNSGLYLTDIISYTLIDKDKPATSIMIPAFFASGSLVSMGYLALNTNGSISAAVIDRTSGQVVQITESDAKDYDNVYIVNGTWVV